MAVNFPSCLMCSSVTFKCKKAATPRFIWQIFFRTKRWGRNSQRNGFHVLFFKVFSCGIFCKHISTWVLTCLVFWVFRLWFSGRGKAPPDELFFFGKAIFHHQLTPLKFNILNPKNHPPLKKEHHLQIPAPFLGFKMYFWLVLVPFSYRNELVETASYYPFTDLSTSKNMSLINLNVMYHKS